MTRLGIAVAGLAGICLILGTARSGSWLSTLDRADLLVRQAKPDSAEVLIEEAISEALSEYGASDSTVELVIYDQGIGHRYHFRSHDEAESLYTRILSISESMIGANGPGHARHITDLARLYFHQERYAEAESLYRESLAIRLEALGPAHLDVAESLTGLAAARNAQGGLADAESLYRRALAIRESKLEQDHLMVAQSLDGLGKVLRTAGRLAEAESLHTRALAIREEALGPDHPEVARSLNGLAGVRSSQGKHGAAESLFRRAVNILETHLGAVHSDVANNLRNLAISLEYQAEYAEAESLYLRALEIWRDIHGSEHTLIADGMHSLGTTYLKWGKYAEAESLFLLTIAMKEKILDPDHWKVGDTLNNLGNLYKNQGRYAQAEALHKRALAIRKKEFGPEHAEVAGSANNLASVYWRYGRFDDAEIYYKRAIAIKEKALGPEHRSVKSSLANLGRLYVDLGRYAEAEPLLKRALAIGEKTMGPEHPMVANSLSNLADLYRMQGRYDEAEINEVKALAICRKTLGPEHPYVAMMTNNLAIIYDRQGRSAEAESLYIEALALSEKTLGPEHPEVALHMNNLGSNYYEQGRLEDAEGLHRRAIVIWEKGYGPEHPKVAAGVSDLAHVALELGRHQEAESLYTRALAIRRNALGPDHHLVALALESMCRLCRLQGRRSEALDLAAHASEIRYRNFTGNASVLSEKDALTYSKDLRKALGTCIACYFESGAASGEVTEIADIVLSSKGQVSDEVFERRKTLVEESDSATVALGEKLRFTKFELSRLVVGGPDEDLEGYRSEVDSLGRLANELETALSHRSTSFRKHQDRKNVSARRIASLLPQNSVLVEYVRYDYPEIGRQRTEPHYMAIVLDQSTGPLIIDLGQALEIDNLVEDYRRHMVTIAMSGRHPTVIDQRDYDELCERIASRVWDPIAGHLRDRDGVFIAPDGALCMISFAGLKDGSGQYLVEAFPIHHLSSGRDLIRFEHEQVPAVGLFALGDPDYGALVSDRLAAMEPEEDGTVDVAFVTRNVRSSCRALNESEVIPLPGTRREVESLSASWLRATDEPVTVRLGREASEECFKAEAPGNRLIHLATHGYFLGSACRAEDVGMDFVGENPLLLSGLFLAGANLHGEGAEALGAEDGILTAYEVSAMDLEGTELVVLSACETGIGEVEEGEGVYGLRRAFQVAGARTVVSALWPVGDEVTAEMMSGLYDRQDETLPETIRRIQLEKLNELRKDGKTDHPFTWGAFAALGDWR